MFGYNFLRKLILQLELDVAALKKQDFRVEIEQLKTQVISLRGLVNRKLGGSTEDTPKDKPYKGVFSLE